MICTILTNVYQWGVLFHARSLKTPLLFKLVSTGKIHCWHNRPLFRRFYFCRWKKISKCVIFSKCVATMPVWRSHRIREMQPTQMKTVKTKTSLCWQARCFYVFITSNINFCPKILSILWSTLQCYYMNLTYFRRPRPFEKNMVKAIFKLLLEIILQELDDE